MKKFNLLMSRYFFEFSDDIVALKDTVINMKKIIGDQLMKTEVAQKLNKTCHAVLSHSTINTTEFDSI